MKNIILLLFAAGVVLSCKQEEYTGYLTHDGMEEVALITLSPNSPVLTADGRSELVFKVKPFMEVEHTRRVEYIVDNRSVVKDSTYAVIMAVRPDLIDPADITITASTGETLDGLTYKTSTGAGGEVTFTAKYKGLTSDPHTVKIVAPTAYDPVTIPVVFHLLPDTQDEELYATFGTEFFQHLLDRTNAVFGGKLGNDPAAADARVSFVLATKAPDGTPLDETGLTRANMGARTNGEVETYMNANLLWDPSRYLNIYVRRMYGRTPPNPPYILSDAPAIVFRGTRPRVVADASAATYTRHDQIGLWFAVNDYLQNDYRSTHAGNFEEYLGRFFGLYPTLYDQWSWNNTYKDMDFCPDTYTSLAVFGGYERCAYAGVATPAPGTTVDYDMYNVMDGSGRRTSFTHDQVARMRTVMAYCPLRMMRQ